MTTQYVYFRNKAEFGPNGPAADGPEMGDLQITPGEGGGYIDVRVTAIDPDQARIRGQVSWRVMDADGPISEENLTELRPVTRDDGTLELGEYAARVYGPPGPVQIMVSTVDSMGYSTLREAAAVGDRREPRIDGEVRDGRRLVKSAAGAGR